MRNIVFIVAFTLSLYGCNNEKKQQDELYEEVMAIHDEVMPQMSTLMKIEKNLKAQVELNLNDSLAIDSAKLDLLNEVSNKVKKANESMMDWMHNFKQVEDGTPHGEVMKYLKEQKESISKVKDEMIAAKKEGEKYINAE